MKGAHQNVTTTNCVIPPVGHYLPEEWRDGGEREVAVRMTIEQKIVYIGEVRKTRGAEERLARLGELWSFGAG
jgi:hypothetical protein